MTSQPNGFVLSYLHNVVFHDIPLQWLTRFELFTPDLENFPLMYVHEMCTNSTGERVRVFGFPSSINSEVKGSRCSITIRFFCNLRQGDEVIDATIRSELSHRFGIANKVEFSDLEGICNGSQSHVEMLQSLWSGRIDSVYGGSIPHGRLYEKVFGIVRFSASGVSPRLGKTSELRMTYWFLKAVGEEVRFEGELSEFDYFDFSLLPTAEELRSTEFAQFPLFSSMFSSIRSFWESEYTETFRLHDRADLRAQDLRSILSSHGADETGSKTVLLDRINRLEPTPQDSPLFRSSPKGSPYLPVSGNAFKERYESTLGLHYDNINRLCQIFNRNPVRMYGFIWNLMTYVETDFENIFSQRQSLKHFLQNHHSKKGSSSKVLACVVQQVFGFEAIPVDTWVKTFLLYPMGFNPTDKGTKDMNFSEIETIYSNFSNLDKLEKLIWVSAMANKTNKREFTNILWCQRYGTVENSKGPCRGANPLSCSRCELRTTCIGFSNIAEKSMCVHDSQQSLELSMIAIDSLTTYNESPQKEPTFGVKTTDGTPREVFLLDDDTAKLRDEHTGNDFSTTQSLPASGSMTVQEFVDLMGI